MKGVYETLIDNCTNERLDEIMYNNDSFCDIDAKINKALAHYDTLSIDTQILNIIDLCNEQSAIIRQIAYQQGIKDTIELLKSLGLIIGK